MPTLWTLIAAGLAAGIVLAAAGARSLGRTQRRRDVAHRCLAARAVVTGIGPGATGVPPSAPDVPPDRLTAVRYRDRAGGVHESVLAVVRPGGRYAVGQEIDVLYDPQDHSLVLDRGDESAGRGLAARAYVAAGAGMAVFSAGAAAVSVLGR